MAQTKYKTDCNYCAGKGFRIRQIDFRGTKVPDYSNPIDCEMCCGTGDETYIPDVMNATHCDGTPYKTFQAHLIEFFHRNKKGLSNYFTPDLLSKIKSGTVKSIDITGPNPVDVRIEYKSVEDDLIT